MNFTKCDRCKKLKKENKKKASSEDNWVSGSLHVKDPMDYIRFDLCGKCSPHVVRFLKKYVSF